MDTPDEISELRAQLAALQNRIDELETDLDEVEPERMGRRRMLQTAAAAAAGVAAGGLAFAKPAAAADGDNIVIGNATQTANSPTALVRGSTYSTPESFGIFHVTDDPSQEGPNAIASCISAIASGNNGSTIAFFGAGSDIGAKLDGPVPLKIGDSTESPAPTAASGTAGQFKFVGGDLWYCTRTKPIIGTGDAVWRKLAAVSTAGSLHPIAPARVYDSRLPMDPMPNGVLSSGANRTISVANSRDINNGTVDTNNIVPAAATAVTFNITAIPSAGTGFLSVTPGSASTFAATTLNFSASNAGAVANASVSPLDANRQLKVFCGGTTASSHFTIDITGYYM